jgi:glycogen operon protein
MIAFRKSHPSLGRSVFWRDDVKWYGVSGPVDLSDASRSLAYYLRGASTNNSDLYVMINAYWEPMAFTIQEGEPGDWTLVVDTDKDDPNDFAETLGVVPVLSPSYTVQPRSLVVLVRP